MSKKGPGRILAVALVWLLIAAAAAAAYKFIVAPKQEDELVKSTSAPARDDMRELKLSLDAFSGYCVFRSPEMQEELELEGIFLDLIDDGADYGKRIDRLRREETPLAVFTVDALIKASASIGELPGTIVMVLDESRGADALLAHEKVVPEIDALNRPDARIVVTADSPSETLARVVRGAFQLPALSEDYLELRDGPDTILAHLERDGGQLPRAYALWEPYVSRALEIPGVHVLTDSAKFQGYIVDVLVAEREFLTKHPEDVAAVVKSYLRAYYTIRGRDDGMLTRVRDDAKGAGERLSDEQVRRLTDGIRWKNTTENYAHLGVISAAESQGLMPLERIVRKITRLLKKSGAIAEDPTEGRPNRLFYDGVFRQLLAEKFHPGAVDVSQTQEGIQGEVELRALSESEWAGLQTVAPLEVERISFARGSHRLTEQGQRSLEELTNTLEDWPRYYLVIRGHASSRGDADANRRLAAARAQAVEEFLTNEGVSAARIRARGEEPKGGSRQHSVSFLFAELPY